MQREFIAVGLTCLGLVLGCARASAGELTAGVAVVDLTPPLKLKPTLGGYAARMNRPAEGIHDRILAKAVVLRQGDRKFALVTADMLGFPPSFKSAVLDKLAHQEWSADQVILLPSHSHTSIDMNAINPLNIYNVPQIGIHNPPLYELTVSNIARVIDEAGQRLVPVKVGSSSIEITGWNRNRRIPNGPIDPELTLLRVDTTEDKPLAVFVNWTAHPTTLGPGDMLFSGDWPGALQRKLEALIGRGVVVLYANGAEGDQAVIYRPSPMGDQWDRAERYGSELAQVALRLWEKTATRDDEPFRYHLQEITLPERAWHPNFKATFASEFGLSEELPKDILPQMYPARSASVSLQLGELVIIGIPGELGTELGLKIKEHAKQITGASHPIIGGLADEWISYIISLEQYNRGEYEAGVSFYGPKLGETIVDGALAGVRKLNAKKIP
jgi:neutral ceramidase